MNRTGEQKEGETVPFIIIDFLARRKKPTSSGTVKGTFDDLSDDEKTKAFLQLLEYKLRLEQEQKKTKVFERKMNIKRLIEKNQMIKIVKKPVTFSEQNPIIL